MNQEMFLRAWITIWLKENIQFIQDNEVKIIKEKCIDDLVGNFVSAFNDIVNKVKNQE